MPSADDTVTVDSRRDAPGRIAQTFGSVRPVVHVPFGEEAGEPVADAELRRLVEWLVGWDVAGMVVLGLASEASALTERERDAVVAVVAGALAGRRGFVVGVEGTTAVALDRARRAAEAGASGLMVLPPSGARSADAIVAHYARIGDEIGLPVLVQDAPQVSGVALEIPTLTAIARSHPLAVAVKVEGQGAGAKVSALVSDGVAVVAGWGGLNYLEAVRRGAIGCMPGCDLAPALVVVDRLARAGRTDDADALYRQVLPLLAWEAQSLELLILGAKRHLRRCGIFGSERMRSPRRELDEWELETIDAALERLAADRVPGFGGEA